MIKAVLFDHGGVLSEGGKAGAIRQIFAKAYKLDPETLRFEDIGLDALKGTVSDDAFLVKMNQHHAKGTSVVTRQDFMATVDHLVPSEAVYDLARRLRKHGIRTAILSNTFRMTAESLRKRGLYDEFAPLILSCDVGMAKPERGIYELALKKLNLRPQEVLFIDDQQPFLDPAKALGIHTILAVSPTQIVRDTERLLQQENNLRLAK